MSHPNLLRPTPVLARRFARLPTLGAVFDRARRVEPALVWTAVAHAALVPLFLVLMPFDGRSVLGIDPWVKPLKFAASIAIYSFTVALMLAPLTVGGRARAFVRWGTAIPLSLEMAAIAMQSARGTTSHFNDASAFDAIVFAAMGVAILVTTAAGVVLLVLHLRSRALAPTLAWGVRAGISVSLVGAAVGGAMVSNEGHAVGADEDSAGLPLVNWSRDGGDLRIAHFAGLHALQALPLVGFLVQGSRRGVAIVGGATALYVVLVGGLFALAIIGRPIVG